MGLIIGDGREPGICSTTSAIQVRKDICEEVLEVLGWLFDVNEVEEGGLPLVM
jgi:hypothetical protein